MNIFVGNLNYITTEDSLQQLFEEFGEVQSAKLISDRETGRSRGFAFIEMPNDDEANAAINGLNGRLLDGRPLRINEAKKGERPAGGGGGGGFRQSRAPRW